MKLLIFSGAGDPSNKHYKPVYDIIVESALCNGFDEVELVKWPGQYSFGEKVDFEMNNVVTYATEVIKKAERFQKGYFIIGRSLGSHILIKALSKLDTHYLSGAVCWGPGSKKWFSDFFNKRKESGIWDIPEKGIRFSSNYKIEDYLIENDINNYPGKIQIKILIGEKDNECSSIPLVNYLKLHCHNKNFIFDMVKNVGHEVSEPNEEYLKKLFY